MFLKFSLVTLVIGLGTACTSSENGPCTEAMSKQSRQTISETIRELDEAADSIEGSLDIQAEGGLQDAQERALRRVEERLRKLSEELDRAIESECL